MGSDEESNYILQEKVAYLKINGYVKDKYGVNFYISYILQVKWMG